MKKLLVLCGGQSPEHTISLKSTSNILKALDSEKYEVTLIGISRSGSWRLITFDQMGDEIVDQGKQVIITPGLKDCLSSEGNSLGIFDAVFPVLHGPNGEDGTMQGLLQLLNIPFVGPGVLSAAVSMDKDVTKRLLSECDIAVAPSLLVRKGDAIPAYNEVIDALGVPVFVKPANMGSSVGVHRVQNEEEWSKAITDALSYDDKVVVEKGIEGRELECAVLGNDSPKATCVGEVKSGNFYSFDEKYDAGSDAEIIIPASVEPKTLALLKETAVKAYQALDCQGLSRVDMFLTEKGEILVNEVNAIPGFTDISMYPKLWENEGLDYSSLIDTLIELALESRA